LHLEKCDAFCWACSRRVQGGAFAGGSVFNLHTTSHHDKRPLPAKLQIGEQTENNGHQIKTPAGARARDGESRPEMAQLITAACVPLNAAHPALNHGKNTRFAHSRWYTRKFHPQCTESFLGKRTLVCSSVHFRSCELAAVSSSGS